MREVVKKSKGADSGGRGEEPGRTKRGGRTTAKEKEDEGK